MTTASGSGIAERNEVVRKIRRTPDGELEFLSRLEQAYVGWENDVSTQTSSPHHPAQTLSPAEMAQADFLRYWKPRNFLAKVIEEPQAYLGLARPRFNVVRVGADGSRIPLDPDNAEDKAQQAAVEAFYQRKIRPRQADLVLWQGWYGRAFVKLAYDPGTYPYLGEDGNLKEHSDKPSIHVIPYPRFEGGIERAEAWHDGDDPDRITAAVVYWLERDPEDPEDTSERKHAQLLYPDRIEWLRHTGSGWVLDPERSQSNTGIDYHPWGVVPMIEVWNNGKPDVTDALDLQATLNKDIYDMNAHGATVAFPQRYRKGLIPVGGWHRDPITGRREEVAPLKSGPFIVWDVPSDGEVGQLPADMGVYLLQKYTGDIEDLATLTRSVAVSKMKQSFDVSGESKHMDTVQLLGPRISGKGEALGSAIRQIFRTLFAMAKRDPAIAKVIEIDGYQDLDVEVEFEIELDRDAVHEATLDQQDRAARNISLFTYLLKRGFTEDEARKEVQRIEDERAKEMEQMAENAAKQETAMFKGIGV